MNVDNTTAVMMHVDLGGLSAENIEGIRAITKTHCPIAKTKSAMLFTSFQSEFVKGYVSQWTNWLIKIATPKKIDAATNTRMIMSILFLPCLRL